jgi:hypothetical protein
LAPELTQVINRLIILKAVAAHAMAAPPRHILDGLLAQSPQFRNGEFAEAAEAARREHWTPLLESPYAVEMSPWELEFSRTSAATMTGEQQMNACWRIESLKALLWAVGLVDSLGPPDTPADGELLHSVCEERLHSARLRAPRELENERSLAELWHWRSRTERLIRERHPFAVEKGPKSFSEVVKMSAKAAFQKGDIKEIIRDDFPARGKAYAELTADEWAEVTSISVERHYALNWVCGRAPMNRWDETPTST